MAHKCWQAQHDIDYPTGHLVSLDYAPFVVVNYCHMPLVVPITSLGYIHNLYLEQALVVLQQLSVNYIASNETGKGDVINTPVIT